jgi:hypothetical protein
VQIKQSTSEKETNRRVREEPKERGMEDHLHPPNFH